MSPQEHHNIEMLAYYLWLSRGYPEGQADAIWFEAEHKFYKYVAETSVVSETSLFGLAAIEDERKGT